VSSLHAEHRIVEVAGYGGRVTEVGHGPPLLLLPSMLVLADSYQWLLQRLAPRYSVTLIEMPGVGRGQKLPRPWGFDQYASWLAAYLDLARAERAPIIGHSNSAAAAMILAARRPDLLSHLLLADPVGLHRSLSLSRVLAGRAIDAVREMPLSIWGFRQPLFNLLHHTRNCLNQIWLAAKSDLRDAASQVRAPTLLAWGANDRTMPLRCLRLAESLMPHARVYVSRSGSHDWLITHADEFTAALGAFLAAPPESR
jgi:pimeloyl-ACP methyl ester carboxylesterase